MPSRLRPWHRTEGALAAALRRQIHAAAGFAWMPLRNGTVLQALYCKTPADTERFRTSREKQGQVQA